MLPRVTMPRITLGKEREDRDKQHESLRCSCRTKHPLSASLQESVQLLHGNNAALSMGHLGSVCLQETECSSQRFWRLTHKAAGAVGPSEHQALCISAPCNWRGLPAVSESFWKAQTFFTLWSVLLKGVTARDKLTPVWLISLFPTRIYNNSSLRSAQLSNSSILSVSAGDLQGDKAHSSLLGTPWFTGVTAALHCNTACWRNSVKALIEVGTFGVGCLKREFLLC